MTEKLIPFDLAIALAHPERVRTRDGRKVYGFSDDRAYGCKGSNSVSGIIDGTTWRTTYFASGNYPSIAPDRADRERDLMLAEPDVNDQLRDAKDQLELCAIAAHDYDAAVEFGKTIPSGYGDAAKRVLTLRQNMDAEIARRTPEPQPDANGWYKIGEIRPPKNTAVIVGRMRGAFDKAEGWYETFTDNVRDDLSMWSHWRYPKPPVELEDK